MSITKATLAAIVVLAALFLAVWLWLLASPDPVNNPLAARFPWPVACSTRGCITSTTWVQHTTARAAFAAATKKEPVNSSDALTTLVRQHLTEHAQVRSPVTAADARRYREEILNLKTDEKIRATTTLSLEEYDEYVVLPFLQQEALRQQRNAETADDLYQQLASERSIFVIPFALKWDSSTAKVIGNSLYIPASK